MAIRKISRRPRSVDDTKGSLRSYYGDAEDNVDQKMNLCFTYESRDTLNSFCLFITVKAITKLNLGNRNKFEKKLKKLAVVVYVLHSTQNLVISRCCFAENGKEMYKDL